MNTTLKNIYVLFFLVHLPLYAYSYVVFIPDDYCLKDYYNRIDVVMVTSTGRSGSTMLTLAVDKFATNYLILKSHILPPEKHYKGKILFIFSNPDRAAESALHITLQNAGFGYLHFYHMTTADMEWLWKIGDTTRQTSLHNLLCYDALGCYKHLVKWLYKTKPSDPENAQILAIKYENLWDQETIQAIKRFLNLDQFELPDKQERGCKIEEMDPREIEYRRLYNVGTENNPKYTAYDLARMIWEKAPPFQYLQIDNEY